VCYEFSTRTNLQQRTNKEIVRMETSSARGTRSYRSCNHKSVKMIVDPRVGL